MCEGAQHLGTESKKHIKVIKGTVCPSVSVKVTEAAVRQAAFVQPGDSGRLQVFAQAINVSDLRQRKSSFYRLLHKHSWPT